MKLSNRLAMIQSFTRELVILPYKSEPFIRSAETSTKDVVERIKIPTPDRARDDSITDLIVKFVECFKPRTVN